ncbi:hypothetical protein EGM_12362, partial [Macaca fascicularis]
QEENKILFYHPNEVEKNEKIRNVGLCEAIVQFTRTFSPSKPAKSLHTQKNRQFFNEPEEHFWMVMVVRNPIIEKQSKDGKPVIEYQEEELLLFNGTFLKAMEDGGIELLKERLEKFFHRSGLEQDDMRILYKYLTTSLFPRHLAGRDSPIRAEMPGNLQHYGAMSAAVCFMIDDFCRRLDSVVGPQLTVLASDICEQFNINKRMSGSEKEPQFKFIYFNHMNLAEKSTVHMRKTPSVSLTSVHPDLMKILGDINSDFTRVDEDEEIIVKAMSDYWVVGKKSDRRELYVILNQKNANLIEV